MPRATDVEPFPTPQSPPKASFQHFDPVTVGTCFGILSALAYTAANVSLRQLAERGGVDWAIWVSCTKAVPATVVAWMLIGYRASRGLPALPPRRLIAPLLLTGLFMQFGGNVMFQWALSLGGLAMTVPLTFATLILSGAWFGRLYLAEPITRRSAAAMLVLILSIILVSAGADHAAESVRMEASALTVGGAILAACIAGVAYGVCGVVIRHIVKRDAAEHVSLSATLVLLSSSGVVGLGLMSLWQLGPHGLLQTSADDLAAMLTAGVFTAVAFFSVSEALRHIPVTRVNLLNASQTAMCALAGVAWFHEQMTGWLAAGTVLTMLGLSLMEGRRKPTEE